MSMTLSELAERIDATVRGDGSLQVTGCAPLGDAGPGDVSFVANRKYVKHMATTGAGAVVVSPADAESEHAAGRTLLVADDPYYAFRQAVVALHGFREQPQPGISPMAVIDPEAEVADDCCIQPFSYVAAGARVGARCIIYPNCFIGPNARIGDDCVLYPGVVVYDDCVLGDRVILQAGCVIGQDGFGYATHQCDGEEPRHHKIPQIGNVVIEDDVELGANCAIDRATVGSTVIARGTKFSDLVAIGHGSKVGPHNLLVAQVGLAGSVETGRYVVMGGQVGVAGHLRIGDGVQIAATSGVATDIPDGAGQFGGTPAIPMSQMRRVAMNLPRTPEQAKTLKKLLKRVEALEAELAELRDRDA